MTIWVVTRLLPLTGISPQDSKEQKIKDSREWLRCYRFDGRCTGHHGCGILSFLHSHLIHPPLNVDLLSLGWSRASITRWQWCWRSFWCQRRMWTWVGAWISEMTLLSTILAFLAWWVLGWSLVGRSPLNTLITSVWSLKEVGAWNHLPLWGDKSLSSKLRHRLKTLSDGVEDRSSRRRTNAVGALLGLTLLLAIAWQYSFPILEYKSLVYQGLKVLKVSGFQSISKSIVIEPPQKWGARLPGSRSGDPWRSENACKHTYEAFKIIISLKIKLFTFL
jgi:hypothetical protein